jgi:hypothetical protein
MTHTQHNAQPGTVENLHAKIPTALFQDNSNQIEELIKDMNLEDIIQAQQLDHVFEQKLRQKAIQYKTTGVQDTIYRELNIDPRNDPSLQIGRLLRLPADITTAEKIVELDKINTFEPKTKKVQKIPVFNSSIEFFAGKYGLCTWYYFSFLKYLSIQLFIMFLLSLPAIYTNYQGGGITESSNFLLETTLGNTKKFIKGPSETAIEFAARKKQGLGDIAYSVIISDLAYSFSFFLFIIFWRWKSGQILAQYNEQKRDTSHYAVMLKGFPRN